LIKFILNNQEITTVLPKGTTVLDFVRYHQSLTGTKIGCREGDCGACTVLVGEIIDGHLEYRSKTSCLMPIGNAHGKHVVTIEGINVEGLNLIQQAFADEGATQCGFCTPGFIVSFAGYCLQENPGYVIDSVNGNICRCTGYKSIERAAEKIGSKIKQRKGVTAIEYAVSNKILPAYFLTIKDRLLDIIHLLEEKRDQPVMPAKYVGGGTDLYVQQHDTIADEEVELMIDKRLLNGITQNGAVCEFGASVTVSDIDRSVIFQKHFPDLKAYIKLVSSTQIRNMATISGNIANASPIGDFSVFFLALDAKLLLSDSVNKREVSLREFYMGYKQLNKTPDEHIEKISFQLPKGNTKFDFEKVCKRTLLDIASVNTALCITTENNLIADAGFSAGGVAPVPLFLKKASAFLRGKTVTPEVVTEFIDIAQTEIAPISDVRGTSQYKRMLLSQLVKAHFIKLFPQCGIDSLIKV
jgi:xanthine dehydrogenase small subunit